ncbi:MAG: Ig-like domain-containing protein [Acidobacteria bacterium]|nr:Ig-like domain-containing protein [Acidobacteriota bacterium]
MRDLVTCRRVVRIATIAVALSSFLACGERVKNPDNELPQGVVDTPKAGDVLKPGKTLVGGWAVDDSGVSEIRIYFDGHYKTSVRLGVPRPDVARAMPRYARRGDIYGWNVEVDFGIGPGPHTILVQAIDDSGATRDIGVVPVTVPQ